MLGVGADKAFGKNAAGEQVEVLVLDGLEHARADLGDAGDVFDGVVQPLAFFAELVAEGFHTKPRRAESTPPALNRNHHMARARRTLHDEFTPDVTCIAGYYCGFFFS